MTIQSDSKHHHSRLSLAALLWETARRRPHATAIVFGESRISYQQLWDESRRYAAVLRDRGVRAGDRVALLLQNSPDFPRSYYAVQALGAVVVPVHTLLTASEISYQLKDAGARILIADEALADVGKEAADLAAIPLMTTGGSEFVDSDRLDQLARCVDPLEEPAARAPEDDAVILYTSGTTGKPKGAVLTQLNLFMNADVFACEVLRLREHDVILGCLPLFHSFGQTCTMNSAFRVGASLVLLPRFDGAVALAKLVDDEVTVFMGVPTMYLGLLDAAQRDPRRPNLRVAVSGGSALPVAVIDRVKQAFGVDVLEGYGLSETSPVATFNQEVFGCRPGTVGHPIWGVDVAIANPENDRRIEMLPANTLGEVVIRGHCVMKGYHNLPAASRAAIVDGWFRTGDIGSIDDDGFVRIVDRKKDMIVRGGYNVYPREVEDALMQHPAVTNVAVIGVPDAFYGEEVCAVVVRASAAQGVSAEEIVTWSKGRLAKYKYPRRVEFVDKLPLGPSGKVLKRELVARFCE